MTANQTKAPKPGDPLRLDGFLYLLGPVEGLVAGVNRTGDVADFLAANPSARVTIDTATPDRWDVIRSFQRPTASDPVLEARRKANHNYKRSGQCLESDMVWMDGPAFLEHLIDQGAQLVAGTTNPRVKRWREAWVAGCKVSVEKRISAGTFSGAWVLGGRALLKPRENAIQDLDRGDIPEAVEGILTSTYDGAEG